jgi:hypothetical protein
MITCPNCGESDGQKIVGVELQGVYDGVAYWACMACGNRWHRFDPPGRIYDAVQRIFDKEKTE